MKQICILIFMLGVIAPWGKAQDVNVQVNADEETDFSQYKTFYWSPALTEKEEGKSGSMDTAEVQKMKKIIEQKMQALGYTLQEENPDLLVNFYTVVRDSTKATKKPEFPDLGYSFWWGPDWYDRGDYWNGWDFWVNGETHWFYGNPTFYAHQGADTDAPPPGEGSLFIDIIDNEKNMLVWEGYIMTEDKQQEEKASEETIEQEVNALLEEFPAEGKDQG